MEKKSDENLPNIIVIYPDQMRADAMGCAGDSVVKTPYLDRLAGEGTRFENAFVSYPLCCPFRASFLTGKYAHSHGLGGNHVPIDTNQVFLAPLLKKRGYRTGYFGKWHLDGGTKPGFVPPGERRLGFDHFIGFNRGHYYQKAIYYEDTDQPIHCRRYEPDFQTDHLLEYINSCLDSGENIPFFSYISYGPPHFPMNMPEYLKNLYSPEEVILPPGVPDAEEQIDVQKWKLAIDCAGNMKALAKSKAGGKKSDPFEAETEEEIREFIAQYYGMVSNIDHNVGRILHFLDRHGLSENTLVIFMSDHGDMFGQHGHFCGMKRSPYRGSMQVPFIVRYPKRFKGGRTVTSLIDVGVDSMPTLLELCGIEIPADVQGISFLPLLDGTSESTREAVMYEIIKQLDGGGGFMPIPERGIRTHKWLYVRKKQQRKYLFNLENDPHEMNNLVDDEHYAAVMKELDKKIEAHMQATGDDWETGVDFPPANFISHADAKALLEKELLVQAIVRP